VFQKSARIKPNLQIKRRKNMANDNGYDPKRRLISSSLRKLDEKGKSIRGVLNYISKISGDDLDIILRTGIVPITIKDEELIKQINGLGRWEIDEVAEAVKKIVEKGILRIELNPDIANFYLKDSTFDGGHSGLEDELELLNDQNVSVAHA
jgi:hypothetical protein